MKYCVVVDPEAATLPVNPIDEAGSVVGWIANQEHFEPLIEALAPGLVLLDLRRHGDRCGQYVHRVRRCVPEAQVLVLGPPDDLGAAEAALRSGASGYITRPINLARALRSLSRGHMFITQAGCAAIRHRAATRPVGDRG